MPSPDPTAPSDSPTGWRLVEDPELQRRLEDLLSERKLQPRKALQPLDTSLHFERVAPDASGATVRVHVTPFENGTAWIAKSRESDGQFVAMPVARQPVDTAVLPLEIRTAAASASAAAESAILRERILEREEQGGSPRRIAADLAITRERVSAEIGKWHFQDLNDRMGLMNKALDDLRGEPVNPGTHRNLQDRLESISDGMTDAMLLGRIGKEQAESVGVDLKALHGRLQDMAPAAEASQHGMPTEADIRIHSAEMAAAAAGMQARQAMPDGTVAINQAWLNHQVAHIAQTSGYGGTTGTLSNTAYLAGRDGLVRAERFTIAAASQDMADGAPLLSAATRHGILHPADIVSLRQSEHAGPMVSEDRREDVENAIHDACENGVVHADHAERIARDHGMTHPFDLADMMDHAAVRNADSGHMTGMEAMLHFQTSDHLVRRDIAQLAFDHELIVMKERDPHLLLSPEYIQYLAQRHGMEHPDAVLQAHQAANDWNADRGYSYGTAAAPAQPIDHWMNVAPQYPVAQHFQMEGVIAPHPWHPEPPGPSNQVFQAQTADLQQNFRGLEDRGGRDRGRDGRGR